MSAQAIVLIVGAATGGLTGLAAFWKSWSERDATQGTVAKAQVDNALASLGAALLRLEQENAALRADIAVLRKRVAELEREHA